MRARVLAADPAFEPNRSFRLNAFNIVTGIIAQLCLTILPMYLILWQKVPLLITIGILVVTVSILKRTWWDRLNADEQAAKAARRLELEGSVA